MSNVTVHELANPMDVTLDGILAASRDWGKVGANENPFSPVSHPKAYKAYEEKFEWFFNKERSMNP